MASGNSAIQVHKGIIPYLVVPDSVVAIKFYAAAFEAVETMRMPGPGGHGTMHAEIRIANGCVMMTDENPQWEMQSALTLGGSPASLMFYVDNVDEAFDRAVRAGCDESFPPTDMFWGDRMCKVKDPFGFHWSLATHIEDVPMEEMAARQQKWFTECMQQYESQQS